jgi:thiosulfate/3-mercaptopyruvate sulfurtransferase
MRYRTLIGTEQLAASLSQPDTIIVDCRFRLDDVEWGEREYEKSHVPGAVYAHLDADLSGPKTGTNGRHPLPAPDMLNETLGRLGIDHSKQVVAYDLDSGMFASRLWWLLRWMGHDGVAVLDGGFAKWTAEGRPTRSGRQSPVRAQFVGAPRANMVLLAAEVDAIRNDRGWKLIDARAGERYRGETEPIDRVPGHIPGAVNRPYMSNLTESCKFRSPDELRAEFEAVAGNVPADRIVSYCGSGVTACHNLLALEHVGLTGSKLYAGSWSEWSADPTRPIETGEPKRRS